MLFLDDSLAVKVQNTPTVAACLQVLTGARALQFARRQNDAAPLARTLLNSRDSAALFGAFERLVAFEQVSVDTAGELIAPARHLLSLAFKLRAALDAGRIELRPRFFGAAQGLALLLCHLA